MNDRAKELLPSSRIVRCHIVLIGVGSRRRSSSQAIDLSSDSWTLTYTHRTIRMGRQNPRVMESISGLGIFLLVVKEITIKIPGIQSCGSQFDGLLKQLASLCGIAEADRKTRTAIIEHAEAGWSAGIELVRAPSCKPALECHGHAWPGRGRRTHWPSRPARWR